METEKNKKIVRTGCGEKSDRRILRTRQMIQDSFMELMSEKEYESITVTDISARADINRKTFYAHYESVEQLLKQIIFDMLDELFGILMYEKEDPGVRDNRDLLELDMTRFFAFVENNREKMERLLTGQTVSIAFSLGEDVIQGRLAEIHVRLDEKEGQIPSDIFVKMLNSYLFMIIDWWLDQDRYTAAEAAHYHSRMMRKNMASMFRYQRMGYGADPADSPII
jgi:AcrR family transcriptional regulator